jgi:hypothetical protein
MSEHPVPEIKGRAILERLYRTPYEVETWTTIKCVPQRTVQSPTQKAILYRWSPTPKKGKVTVVSQSLQRNIKAADDKEHKERVP